MRTLGDELFELVFERLELLTAVAIVRALLGYDLTPPTESEGVHEVAIESLTLRPDVVLGNVHVRLLCYNKSVYDVELNFRLREATAPSNDILVSALHDFAIKLAKEHDVAIYFAGLDPASDEDTRLFSGKKKGPYYLLE